MISFSNLRRGRALARTLAVLSLLLCPFIFLPDCLADEPDSVATNRFPSVPEVLGGKTFENTTDQDIYFLQSIHDRYASYWPDLLGANITLTDYTLAPEKLLRFVNELGEAMRDRNDATACTNLAPITGDPSFYANATVSRPEIIKAAALALIKIGPDGRKALASAFSVDHYCTDPASLENLADAIGEEHPADAQLVRALTATAFDFTTTNGSFYPHCITAAVKNLLFLNGGPPAVQAHLKEAEMFDNPGRFQAVVDGIAAAHASQLATNLASIQPKIEARLVDLANSPGGYRDDLRDLNRRIKQTLADFGKTGRRSRTPTRFNHPA